MPLWGVVPAFHVAGVVFYLLVEVLDTVGRLQAPSQLLEQAESMERERLLQPLSKGACRLAVDLLQFRVKTGETLFGPTLRTCRMAGITIKGGPDPVF